VIRSLIWLRAAVRALTRAGAGHPQPHHQLDHLRRHRVVSGVVNEYRRAAQHRRKPPAHDPRRENWHGTGFRECDHLTWPRLSARILAPPGW
jgi:hypothetical protein